LNPIELIWAQVKGFVAENNTTFRLKDVKELVYGGFYKGSLSEGRRPRTVFSANKFTEVKHRVHNYWI
jgi:hypothetical protein